jgi:hypothetical protein
MQVAYLLLLVIRALLFVAAYPLTVRIGLKTNIPETIFTIYSGLRGSVGIALAISLNSQVIQVSPVGEQTTYEQQTAQLYQMVGGVAFLTLIVNGITAGPLLKKLGLADEPETRKKIVASYRYSYKSHMVDNFVHLLTYDAFQYIDYAVVREHLPFMASLTKYDIVQAVIRLKESTPPGSYRPPNLSRVLPYLPSARENSEDFDKEANRILLEEDPEQVKRGEEVKSKGMSPHKAHRIKMESVDAPSLDEMRLLFISYLNAQYEIQINRGELEGKGPVVLALKSSLVQAETAAKEGKPINDYIYLKEYEDYWIKSGKERKPCIILTLLFLFWLVT